MESLPLPIADIVILVILIWGMWTGLKKGLIVSIASLIALVAGVYAAVYCSDAVGIWIADQVNWPSETIAIAAFAVSFVGVMFGVHLIAKALEKAVDAASLGAVNKVGGAIFGAAKNAFVISFILYFLNAWGGGLMPENVENDNHKILPLVESIAPTVIPMCEELGRETGLEKLERKVEGAAEDFEDAVEDAADDIKETARERRRRLRKERKK